MRVNDFLVLSMCVCLCYLRLKLAVIDSFFLLFLSGQSVVKQQSEKIHIVIVNSLSHPKEQTRHGAKQNECIDTLCTVADRSSHPHINECIDWLGLIFAADCHIPRHKTKRK